MRLSNALEELLVATWANGRSERTVADYAQKLAPLVEFLNDPEIGAVTSRDLRGYVADLRSRSTRYESHPCWELVTDGLATVSVVRICPSAAQAVQLCHDGGFHGRKPAGSIRVPKRERGEPKAIAMDDVARLLEAINGDDVLGRRDKALLLLLADSEVRVSGLTRLRVSNVDLKQRHLPHRGTTG